VYFTCNGDQKWSFTTSLVYLAEQQHYVLFADNPNVEGWITTKNEYFWKPVLEYEETFLALKTPEKIANRATRQRASTL